MRFILLGLLFLALTVSISHTGYALPAYNNDAFWEGYNSAARANQAQAQASAEHQRQKQSQREHDMYMYSRGFCPKVGGCSRTYVPCDDPKASKEF